MGAAASFVQHAFRHALMVNRQPRHLDECADGTGRVRVRQQDAVDAGRQHLAEHPRVGADGGFVDPVHRHVDDNRRCAVAALCRPAGGEALHVFGEAFDVVRRVLHVVADVVRVGLRVGLAGLERPVRAGVRAGVVDGLSHLEQLDRPIDVLW